MLQLLNVSKIYGTQTVLDNVSLNITPTSRIGLVGRNGAGKSTLFRMMLGEIDPDEGSVNRYPGMTIRCLTQEPQLTPDNTLMEEVLSAFPSLGQTETEEAALLANWDNLTPDEQADACETLATLAETKEQLGHLEANASKMLTGLGFGLETFERKVSQFSGGWQMRINLAKVLLQGADFMLLDEPTNHLDLDAREWLEQFLKDYPGGLVLVTHDRLFLDKVVTEIAELELGRLSLWPGNYTQAQQHKADALEKLASAATRQAKELEKQQTFVERFRASATKSTQAKSREKQLAKVQRIEPPKTDESKLSVRFPKPPGHARDALTFTDVTKSFGEKTLFAGLNAHIERGQRVFLLGENGAGKTTLLRLVLGLETSNSGEIVAGDRVSLGYFSQHQLETLNPKHTALESIAHVAPITMDQTAIRNLLGRFLFTGERVMKPVEVLSGGEKSRLALARLILGDHNVLLLDEPTNHMDIPAQLVMEKAFKEYEGTLLCISHDRYFIEAVATHIWELYRGELIQYLGNYSYYLEKRGEFRAKVDAALEKAAANQVQSIEAPSAHQQAFTAKKLSTKQLAKLEKQIMAHETKIAALEAEMAQQASNFERLQALTVELKTAQQAFADDNAAWESLVAGV